jgi:hypothetical protein
MLDLSSAIVLADALFFYEKQEKQKLKKTNRQPKIKIHRSLHFSGRKKL